MTQVVIVAPASNAVANLEARLLTIGHDVQHFEKSTALMVALPRLRPDLLIVADAKPSIDAADLCMKAQANPTLRHAPRILYCDFINPPQGYAMASAVGAQGAICRQWEPALMLAWVIKFLSQATPLLPANETQRMQALQSAKILDTPPEDLFDALTQVASIVCQTPIALISLVDAERQWFKSRVGLDVEQTSREDAFCAHAIYGPAFLEVRDATKDGRFSQNPLVTGEPQIRFYAGAPLLRDDSYAFGTLCVIDRIPRKLTSEQIKALTALSRLACHLIDSLRRK